MLSKTQLACAIATAFAHLSAIAAERADTQTTDAQALTTLPVVEVKAKTDQETATGPVQGYVARRGATATKTDTPIIETPQSIAVVTRDFMDVIGAKNVSQALGYTAGVGIQAFGDDPRYDWVTLRGFDAYSPGYYLDGLIARNNGTWSTWRLDSYGAERIEVMRGPSSVLYGQNGPGGVINVVSKRPTADPLHEIEFEYGSHDLRQIAGDFSGPVEGRNDMMYRVTLLDRKSITQKKYGDDDRIFIAPALTWKPSADTTLTLLSHFQRGTGSASSGYPEEGTVSSNPNGRIALDTFVGEPGFDKFNTDQWAVGYEFEHRLDDQWTVRQKARYGQLDLDYQQMYGQGFITVNGGNPVDPANFRVIDRLTFGSREKVEALTIDNQVQAKFTLGDWQHTILLGLDYQRNKFDQYSFSGAGPTLDIFAPVYGQAIAIPAPFADADITLTQTGVYLQNQAKLHEALVLVLGGRYDSAKTSTDDHLNASITKQSDDKFTGRAGLVYLAPSGFAPYLSYSESFSPVGTINPVSGSPFKPETGRQYEAGLRYQPASSNTTASIALFDLRRQNYVTYNTFFVPHQNGEILVRGLELEAAHSPLTGMSLVAAYTYTPVAKITKSSNPAEIGQPATATPEQALSLWGDQHWTQGVLAGIRAGLGMRYVGTTANINTTRKVPAYTLFDSLLEYDRDDWRLALNVRNLTNKHYVTNCGYGACYYGSGRSMIASAKYHW